MASLIILVIMCVLYTLKAEPTEMLFYIYIAVCVYAVYHELTQATTMRVEAFAINLVLSMLAFAGAATLIAIIISNGDEFKPYIILGSAVIILDAIVFPIIAFKMALGNISFGGR